MKPKTLQRHLWMGKNLTLIHSDRNCRKIRWGWRMGSGARNLFLLITACLMLFGIPCYGAKIYVRILRQGESLVYPQKLYSESGDFSLYFFNPFDGYRNNRDDYVAPVMLGLFYNNKAAYGSPVWVAEGNHSRNSANLMLGNDGSLKISQYGGGSSVLYRGQAPCNCSVVLLDNGNIVVREFNSDGSVRQDLWQSFDHPIETLLPGMKLGFNNKTGLNQTLVSLKDESFGYKLGSFTLGIDQDKRNQLVIRWLGDIYWTSGSWENGTFTSPSGLSTNEDLIFHYVSNENETYFSFSSKGGMLNHILLLGPDGSLVLITTDSSFPPHDIVSCSFNSRYDDRCMEKIRECRKGKEYFLFMQSYVGIMSGNGIMIGNDLTEEDCWLKCFNDCSCVAYSFLNDTDCEIWRNGSTFRSVPFSDGGRRVYTAQPWILVKKTRCWKWFVVALGGAASIVITWFCYGIAKRCKRKVETRKKQKLLLREIGGDTLPSSTKRRKEQRELQIFNFKNIVTATNNFSDANKLGKGGYGPVYKGSLPDGQEIAIKRLSNTSGQGLVEFKNEVILIAKLQHTNLVRLLGFCVQGEEKALVYEYMPNKSLDFFIFDSTRKKILNWKKRFVIIEGIAQGLVYLHKYSRLKVVHRDLKVSNILLDLEMNPKIADFGMARLLGPTDSEENTNRIVGTFGYMAPEYALQGIVSMKTDVFSFGILLLEIVSGKKNNNRYHPDHPLNLMGFAWSLWKEGRGLELIDASLDESIPPDQALRCIHVGLLCVQDQANHRPTMTDVVFMLSNESAELSLPRKPAFFISTIAGTSDLQETSRMKVEIFSVNEQTMSNMEAR